MGSLWHPVSLMRRCPATVVLTIAVTVGFALQWFLPLESLLQRDGRAIAAGEWWRVVTAVFVQGSGWGQYIFNTLGLVVVGAAVERTRGTLRWVIGALVAQVGTSIVILLWRPIDTDSGSSLVVGGLVGMLTVTRFTAPAMWAWVSTGYRVFFVCYLAGLALGGPVAGAIAGSVITAVAVSAVIRSRNAAWALTVVLAVVAGASVILAVMQDAHGIAVLIGIGVALVVGRPRRREVSGRSAALP